jgi:hypothetical protein
MHGQYFKELVKLENSVKTCKGGGYASVVRDWSHRPISNIFLELSQAERMIIKTEDRQRARGSISRIYYDVSFV